MAKGIYKRGTVYWIRYAGLDGKIVYESTGSAKFDHAETLLTARKRAIDEGKKPEIKKIKPCTFTELAKEYKKWAQGRHRSAESMRYRVDQIAAHFGNVPLSFIDTRAVEGYQTMLIGKGLKPATVNRHLGIVKLMVKKAVDWKWAHDDTLKDVRKVKMIKVDNQRKRFITREECEALINACTKRLSHLRPIVITALHTGMRRAELLSLKWEQVDLKHGLIYLVDTKNGEKRELPVNSTLRALLQSLTRRLDVPWVFYDPFDGKRYHEVKHSFKQACKIAGITDFRFHDLRHTFASHLVMSGVDLKTVQELLGHKTMTMTLRYAHLAAPHKKTAVDMLDSTLTGKPTIQKLYNPSKREVAVNA